MYTEMPLYQVLSPSVARARRLEIRAKLIVAAKWVKIKRFRRIYRVPRPLVSELGEAYFAVLAQSARQAVLAKRYDTPGKLFPGHPRSASSKDVPALTLIEKSKRFQCIIDAVLEEFGPLSRADLLDSDSRKPNLVLARQALAYIALKVTGWSRAEIGRRMKRDHTTVMHSERKMGWLVGDRVQGQPHNCGELGNEVDVVLAERIERLIYRLRLEFTSA